MLLRLLTLLLIGTLIGGVGGGVASSYAQTSAASGITEYTKARQGDVQIRLNGGKDKAFIGATNTLEIWIANGEPLLGMSIGFEFTSAVPFKLVQPYGTKPATGAIIKEEGDAAGAFDFGGLNLKTCKSTKNTVDSLMLGGAAMKVPLPKHAKHALCYTLQFIIPPGQPETPKGFCVDNAFIPPAGSWTFNDGVGYPPTFQGSANTSSMKPTAPAVCFDIVKQP